MSIPVRFSIVLLLAGLASISSAKAAAPEGYCWADWSDAAPVVRKEALRPAKEIADSVKARGKDVVKVTLCQEKGRIVYRMVVVSTDGKVENVTVDALKPF